MASSAAFPIIRLAIPYTSPPSRLRTLSLYFPRPLEESDPANTVWVIYIHGGAWRDPLQTAQCIEPTLAHFTNRVPSLNKIAAIASINYRLSPYPTHPTDPSSKDDEERNAKHPDHVRDVKEALAWLRREYGVGQSNRGGKGFKWIGVGHSCGATLLLQLIAGVGLPPKDEGSTTTALAHPSALILLAGIYNIPLLLENHQQPSSSPEFAAIYKDIIQGAFGKEKSAWEDASPSYHPPVFLHSMGLTSVMLAHSPYDELVEKEQDEAMLRSLKSSGWTAVEENYSQSQRGLVECRNLSGSHDFVWEEGSQVAELISEVIPRVIMQ
ncbi:alpha/beta-hydrolase [Westerdykella ornata]|uniref:Kynurenine formamidase n=1 Tax=Westerdykella ornata TaxID=318751 RepID=A0A6A6JA92_WESOR|nr:alpha/beta-hydrolase [Westerdykella ornata]KAF2272546.1 alpha/beta-hydrolase [Westerdykella ornata]